jgi:L-aminopeptidase/D-esterase-like protein
MRTLRVRALALLVVLAAATPACTSTKASPGQPGQPDQSVQPALSSLSLTSVPGVRVGHFTLSERPTGCTVVLLPPNTVGGVDVRGAAPGTMETDLLRPENLVPHVNAVFLTGGSAFGLDVHAGVVAYLESQKIGFSFGNSFVPIVPGAVIFDLGVGDGRIRPGRDCGMRAASSASAAAVAEGSVGAGAGATVGKFGGGGPMKGGVGTTAFKMNDGLIVAALVVTNAAGSIVDPATGKPVAGARAADGKTLEDPRALIRRGIVPTSGGNTTLGVIITNATLTKAEAMKIAQMAHDGFARAIYPVHTRVDGDTIFAFGTGGITADTSRIGALAAEAMSDAILRSVRAAKGILPNYPGIADIR